MSVSKSDTIVALASAAGAGWRGIVRISGAEALRVVSPLIKWENRQILATECKTRQVVAGSVVLDSLKATWPCRVYIWPEGGSYTGETVVEIHTWQIPPLLNRLLVCLCEQGARPAKPGEFTLRAFLHGRIDLPKAEAVLGVIDASAEKEMRVALNQLGGGLSRPLAAIRTDLLDLLADVEAGLDFVEDDITFVTRQETVARVNSQLAQLRHVADQMTGRISVGPHPRIALWGRPNVGKSTLLNALVGHSVAVESPTAGTTRDSVRAQACWHGMLIECLDTAGLIRKDSELNLNSEIAIRTEQAAEATRDAATMEVLCVDGLIQPDTTEREWMQQALNAGSPVVITKADGIAAWQAPIGTVAVSAQSGLGIAELRLALVERIRTSLSGDMVASTAARCRTLILEAIRALESALEHARHASGDELVAGDLWETLAALGEMVGAVYSDDLLDRVFSRFCIGK